MSSLNGRRLRPARVVVAVLLGAAVFAAMGALVFGQVKPADASPVTEWQPQFPGYPGARTFPMADDASLEGQPFKLAYFVTDDRPEAVVRYYAAYWKSRGMLVDGSGTAEAGRLTALDTADGTLFSLAIRPEGNRHVVFCSVMPSQQRASGVELKAPEGALVSDSLVMDGAQTLTYVAAGTMDEQVKAVTARFTSQGWRPAPDRTREDAKSVSLEFERPGSVAHATLAREREDRAVAVQLQVSASHLPEPAP